MKELLKYLGLFLILAGVVVLGFYAFASMISNLFLIIAALLLVGGLALYILFNRIFD
ncbi:hypothetical protein [Geofilum rubicundum]|uniref:Uncharacterized protein n=1 Tax=Geofilum rubicundum JCM 15548 TaxID=1236989 RepID=A0A0E9LSH7_9BACT|nr:hypothetical protein [Geofilum rubicundum]GAO28209.1 hypothetical protein JCM15548_275 [Geofilum rubicundum JCM 15548]